MKTVDSRLLKYIPKKMQPYVVWLDYERSSHVYFLTFEKDGREVHAEPSDTVSELAWNARQCKDELFNSGNTIGEAYTNASLMNVRNQLMNKLGDDFDVIGGSTVPKVKITPRKFPEWTFDIAVNGQNVEVLPNYNNMPDFAHKIKGIAYMQAANTIYDFIMRMIRGKNESIKLRIRE